MDSNAGHYTSPAGDKIKWGSEKNETWKRGVRCHYVRRKGHGFLFLKQKKKMINKRGRQSKYTHSSCWFIK